MTSFVWNNNENSKSMINFVLEDGRKTCTRLANRYELLAKIAISNKVNPTQKEKNKLICIDELSFPVTAINCYINWLPKYKK